MIVSRERDALVSELGELERLLDAADPDDYFARLSFEGRRAEVEERLRDLDNRRGRTASATLLFRGRPVAGSKGIEASFGGQALDAFQGLVSLVAAARGGQLGARGPIPDEGSSRLLVTGVAVGSFGFELEENADVPLFDATPLSIAVEDAGKLIEAALDDEAFADAVEHTEPRVVQSLTRFLQVVANNDAILRVKTGDLDVAIEDSDTLRAALERTTTLREEADEPVAGVLQGVLPGTRKFEFRRLDTGEVITGKVSRDIPDVEALKHRYVDAPRAVAHLRVITFRRPGREYRRYELMNVTGDDGSDAAGT